MKDIEFSGIACYDLRKNVSSSSLGNDLSILIMETDPKPNYYALHNFPENKHVHSWKLFIPVKNASFCFQDLIFRNAPVINEKIGEKYKIAPGQMTIFNEQHACIRISSGNVDSLSELVDELKELGIHFFKKRKVEEYESTIYYKKYTEFLKIRDGVYQNRKEGNHYFFEVPAPISFDVFGKGMKEIKNNCDFHLFDSFLTSVYLENGVQDFIGIYSEHCDTSRFGDLENEIKNVFHV